MAARPFESLIRRLCSSIEARDREGVQDSELLARFVGQRDEAAFELLVRRHAALVLGVCRRIVGDEHHAEDAFQAAFLTLARKAGSIRQRGSLSSWLCKVAFRSALAAQASAGRSARREQPMDAAALPAGGEPADQAVADEFRRRVDEEVSRLPEKHRLPVRLCYLEGRSNEEAARELGCPVGTIDSRLSRARDRLRERLTRRGVALSAGGLAAALGQSGAQAAVSTPLVAATVQAAGRCLAGASLTGAASANVVFLTQTVLRGLWLAKLQSAAGLLLAATILVLAGGWLWQAYRPGPATVSAATTSTGAAPGQAAKPGPDPDFRGWVVNRSAADGAARAKGTAGWLFLDARQNRGKEDKVSIRLTGDTVIEFRLGNEARPAAVADLQEGQRVEVYFAEPPPPGSPLKVTARLIVIRE